LNISAESGQMIQVGLQLILKENIIEIYSMLEIIILSSLFAGGQAAAQGAMWGMHQLAASQKLKALSVSVSSMRGKVIIIS